MSRIGVKASLTALVAAVVVSIVGFALATRLMNAPTRVGGPLYGEILLAKDLIADVLPSPAYIVESYLVALEVLSEEDAAERARLIARGNSLQAEYEARHEFWRDALPVAAIRGPFLEASYEEGSGFFDVWRRRFLPAVEAGDRERAEALAAGPMRDHYRRHRVAVDEVVRLATAWQNELEGRAAAALARTRNVQIGLTLVALLLAGGLAAAVMMRVRSALATSLDSFNAFANGDLTHMMPVVGDDEFAALASLFNRSAESFHAVLTEVEATANQLVMAAGQLQTATQQLSDGAQDQASSLEQTSASLSQMTTSLSHTADHTKEADRLAAASGQVAERGGEAMRSAVAAMSELREQSQRVASITSAIDEIAFQTNLLALNAAVEAARAGEQGRGFAVVATEVRNLAQRSAAAAREIKELVQNSAKRSESGSEIVNRSGAHLEEIVGSVMHVGSLIREVASSAQEQALAIDEVSQAVARIREVTQGNAGQAERLTATVRSLNGQAKHLQNLLRRFTLAGVER